MEEDKRIAFHMALGTIKKLNMTPTEFDNHHLFEKLNQLSTKITDVEFRGLIGIDDLNFYETALKYIADRLNLTIPSIIQESELSTISTEVQNALSQINSFIGNKNEGHINNSKNHMFTAISRIRNLPLPFAKNDFNFSKSVANFEKIVQEKHSTLEEENDKLKSDFETVKSKLEQTEDEIQRLKKTLEQKETELNHLNDSFKSDYNNIKSSATQNYEQDRKKFRDEFDDEKKRLSEEIESLKESINCGTDDLVKKLEEKLEEAKKIVGVVSDKAVTGNYHNVANENKDIADKLRWIAIILMIILSALLVHSIWDISGGTFDWTKSLIRIFAAAALSYPATYAARESSKHRKLENLNRKAELELTAINPFIELLPEEKKQEIKEKLVEKYFGNNQSLNGGLNEKNDENISIGTIEKIVKTLVPFINK